MARRAKFAQPFPDFEIIDRLGSGAMGTVFKARRRENGELVALKVLRPSLGRNSRYVERLKREAELSERLDHESIIRGFGLGEEAGYHYLVMEFCEGDSLKLLLRAWGSFPEERVLAVGVQIARALAHAHSHGIVHRDVKPGNIIVNEDGLAKLTDLGLAKGERDLTLTSDGATVGTPQYMSPEQATDPSNVDERSDLYSLGATLYHMSTGSPPFDGSSVGNVILKLLRQRVRPAIELNPDLSPGFSLVLRKLLEKDTSVRYQKAKEVLADLERLQRGEDPRIDVRALERAEGRGQRQRLRQRIPIAALLGVCVVLLVILASQLGGSEGDEPAPITQFETLEKRVRKHLANNSYQRAIDLLADYEPSKDERISYSDLESEVNGAFEEALAGYLDTFDRKDFLAWFKQNRELQSDWERVYLEQRPMERVLSRFRVRIDRLDKGVRDRFRSWQDTQRQILRLEVRRLAARLVAQLESGYARSALPEVEALLAQGDYAPAEQRLEALADDPHRCNPERSCELARLGNDDAILAEPLLFRIRAKLAEVRQAAALEVDAWKQRLGRLLIRAATAAERKSFERAGTLLDDVDSSLQEGGPWKSLPKELKLRKRELRGELADARAMLDNAIYEFERKSLELTEDQVHSHLAEHLDLEEAKRDLRASKFRHPDFIAKRDRFEADIRRVEETLDWLLSLLRSKVGKGREAWVRHGELIHARLLAVLRGPPPRLQVRETGPPDSILPLEELDRWDLAQKARSWDREGYEQHSEGLGLFLFYGDDFDHAHQLLSRAGREDHEFAERRERRKKWIADRQGVTKDVVERQTEKARQYIADEDFRRAEFLVKNLRSDYKGSDALQAVETELATIERAIRDDRRERELRDALPVALRRDVSLELGPTGEGSETLELTLDFADPERFSDGLGPSWTKSSRGLSRTGFNGDHPERELRSALTLELPVFQEDASAVIDLDFEIPAEGRPADVLDLTAFGTRFLLVQPPGTSDRRGRLLVDPRKKDLGSLLKRSLKQNGGNSWFLLRGGQYVLRLHFAQTRLGKRNVEMELNNGVVWSKPVNGRAAARPETIVLAVVGGLVLRRIRIEGAARP